MSEHGGGDGRVEHMSPAEALERGLLHLAAGAQVSPWALFVPRDRVGQQRGILLGEGAEVGAGAVVHGGTRVGRGARIEDGVICGQPEVGYALRAVRAGHGAATVLGAEAVLRAGAVVYAGVTVAAGTVVGHHSLLRSEVQVGEHCLLGHHLTIERGAVIGDRVRASPGSHITAETRIEDEVFLGAGVRTVNDNGLDWAPGGGAAPLTPPRFGTGSRVGSGAVILGGVSVGARAVVGAGAVVLHDVADATTVVGNPARVLHTGNDR